MPGKVRYILIGGYFLIFSSSFGQESIIHCSDSTFCVPSVFGMPRAKGIVIRQERVLNYGVKSFSKQEGLEDGEGSVRRNRRWDFKARIPILRKPGIKIALGVRYFHEEYRFEDLPDYPLYRGLENKALKSLGPTRQSVQRNHRDLLAGLSRSSRELWFSLRPNGEFPEGSVVPLPFRDLLIGRTGPVEKSNGLDNRSYGPTLK